MGGIFDLALACLQQQEANKKLQLANELFRMWRQQGGETSGAGQVTPPDEPGWPPQLQLISPKQLPRRTLHTPEGRAALIHSLAHIEFTAINLALDAVCRFSDLPEEFYGDWIRVASEEAYHFSLLSRRLRSIGYDYGRFPVHSGLWDVALKTAHDPLLRMALVPRTLEARGLDVTPDMIERFQSIADQETVEVLEIILRDEIGHVRIGNRWYEYLCEQSNLEPVSTYEMLVAKYLGAPRSKVLNRSARRQAGFGEAELEKMAAKCDHVIDEN